MPSLEKLSKKHVIFKLRNGTPIEGTVFSTETHGIWIQLAANTSVPSVTLTHMGPACMFIPFYQLEWLVVSMDAEDLKK